MMQNIITLFIFFIGFFLGRYFGLKKYKLVIVVFDKSKEELVNFFQKIKKIIQDNTGKDLYFKIKGYEEEKKDD